ncbi:MAG: siderophore-interacting protein [Propionibacteriaceae bacterium]
MALTRAAAVRNATRTVRRLFPMTVTARHPVSANTTRFTFEAPEFGDFAPLGPDEFFALVLPQPGAALPPMVVGPDDDVREVLATIPADLRPAIRWYTVRSHRPDACEIDVDVVLHGDTGPASRWANHAVVGNRVGFREANAPYLAPESGHQVLVADETALPALAAILEQAPDRLDATVLAEAPRPADVPTIGGSTPIQWFHRGHRPPGALVLPALRDLVRSGLSPVGYAWLCGEREVATGARRMLVREAGVDPEMIMFSGYWRLGRARG